MMSGAPRRVAIAHLSQSNTSEPLKYSEPARTPPIAGRPLKNALDWVVGSGELVGKPVALINTSRRAIHAWTSLAETLNVMSALLIRDASITIPLEGRALDSNGISGDIELSRLVRAAIDALTAAASHGRAAGRME